MTITIHTEEDEQRQMILRVEVEEKRVEKAMRKEAQKLGRELTFPGFRKGKVPYRVLLRRVGEDSLRAEAIDTLVPDIFQEALVESQAEPYAQPRLEDIEAKPLVLKFVVPLEPTVTLGEYRELRKEIEEVSITDEAVEEAIEAVQTRHAEVEDVDRPVEAGDLVTISGRGVALVDTPEPEEGEAEEGEEAEGGETAVSDEASTDAEASDLPEGKQEMVIFDQESMPLIMDEAKLFAGTPFVENVVGKAVGDDAEFSFTFPEDYEDEEIAGSEATFKISVINVQKRDLPAIDDELAKLEGRYETLEEMRAGVREELQKGAEEQAKNELIEDMVTDILKDTSITFPPAAVDQEIDQMVENFKNQAERSGWKWEDFLQLQGESEAGIRENFRETAEERLSRQLIIRQFVLDEKIRINDADLDGAIAERLETFDNEELRKGMEDYFRSGYGLETISSQILMDKVHERMQSILSGTAPTMEEIDAAIAAEEAAAAAKAEAADEEE